MLIWRVAGVPTPRDDHAVAATKLALAMSNALSAFSEQHGHEFGIRIGIHSGSLVAGITGSTKFAYDLWGDTVNTASRMESHGVAGRVHISEATASLLPDTFDLEEREPIMVKGKGMMQTYFVNATNQPVKDGSQ